MRTKYFATLAAAFVMVGLLHGAEGIESPIPRTTGPYVIVGPNKLYYFISGKGKHDIVLIHCWAGNLTFWNE